MIPVFLVSMSAPVKRDRVGMPLKSVSAVRKNVSGSSRLQAARRIAVRAMDNFLIFISLLFYKRECCPFFPVSNLKVCQSPDKVDGDKDVLQFLRLPIVSEPMDVLAQWKTGGW